MMTRVPKWARLPGWVRPAFRRVGFDLVRLIPEAHPLSRRMRLLEIHGVDLVIDVGANVGQYATQLRDWGYRGRIVSLEPVSESFRLLAKAAARDPGWETVNLALGSRAGSARINISQNSQSSSLLPILPAHVSSAPEAAYVGAEDVRVETLSWVLERHRGSAVRPFLKLDTQGYERAVIEGAGAALEEMVGLQVELSLIPLYETETLFDELIALLKAKGFTLMSIEPGHTDPSTGQLLQFDGIFFRSR